MINTINEMYFDGLIENTIDVDPAAMYQVLKWMESGSKSINVSNEVEQMNKTLNEEYMDNLIETAIGIDPVAMYQLLNKMDSIIEHPERDHTFSDYIDEITCDIDNQIKDCFANQSDLNLKSEIDPHTIIKVLNGIEKRLERIECNLDVLRKAE